MVGLSTKRLPLLLVIFAALTGVTSKLFLTRGELLPGLDGAYYWVQVRSLLEKNSLAFPDLPLIFWIQSLIAKATGDIQFAVRLSDALLPALSAVPIYLITKKYKNRFFSFFAVLFVLLNPIQLYFFTGDFIKNEAAIPAIFFMALILLNWDQRPKRVSITYLAFLYLLILITHFGTALLAVTFLGFWVLFQLATFEKKTRLRGIGILILAFAGLLVLLAIIVPSRFERLFDFLSTPQALFERPIIDGIVHGYANSIIAFTVIFTQVSVLVLSVICWSLRKNFSPSRLSLCLSGLSTAFLFTFPLVSMEWADRLVGLSIAPLSIALITIYGTTKDFWQKSLIASLAVTALLTSLLFYSLETKRVFSEERYADFKKLAKQVNLPPNSVIIARHGVQYLSAWHFKTDVVLDSYFEQSNLDSYSAQFLLIENQASSKEAQPETTSKKDDLSLEAKDSDRGGKEIDPRQIQGQQVYGNESFTLVRIK